MNTLFLLFLRLGLYALHAFSSLAFLFSSLMEMLLLLSVTFVTLL